MKWRRLDETVMVTPRSWGMVAMTMLMFFPGPRYSPRGKVHLCPFAAQEGAASSICRSSHAVASPLFSKVVSLNFSMAISTSSAYLAVLLLPMPRMHFLLLSSK